MVKRELFALRDKKRAQVLQHFFKTGKGEYGEGDMFLGIPVPIQRKVARAYSDLSLKEVSTLLRDPLHECRFTALAILVQQYTKQTLSDTEKDRIARTYLSHTTWINNWDLVDTSAPHILGHWLRARDRTVLYELAQSQNIWERRIAIIATYTFIQHNDYVDTLDIAEILLTDRHDLIHKAVGWMLREVGKRSLQTEEEFLHKHVGSMPRTMLRYAIEKFSEEKRRAYMSYKQIRT